MSEPPDNQNDTSRTSPFRFPWWAYVLFLLAALGGVLIGVVRGDGEVSPLMIAIIALTAFAVSCVGLFIQRAGFDFGRNLRRRNEMK